MCVAYACIYAQVPPNAELVCKVNGVATTTAVTIAAPVLVMDESEGMTLMYDVELLRMARGGPSIFNATAQAEPIDDEVLVCDEGIGVSLFIDDAPGGCPSPMSTSPSPLLANVPPPQPGQVTCFPQVNLPNEGGLKCASGFTLEPNPVGSAYCQGPS